jgi:hypothetical protein
MGFQGFDTEQIRTLAEDLRSRGENATTLHSNLSGLLELAQGYLGATPATTDPDLEAVVSTGFIGGIFGPLVPPGSLQDEFTETADEMERRLRQLEGCEELKDLGYPIDPAMVFADEDPPDEDAINEAMESLQDLEGQNFGFNGNRDELTAVKEQLDGLTSAELDILFTQTPTDDLRRYHDLVTDTSGSSILTPWRANGLADADRRQHLGDMMSRLSEGNLDKMLDAFPSVEPTLVDENDVDFGPPTEPMFAPDGDGQMVSADDIDQGSLGDCWFMASLAGMAQSNPQFLQEGIRENPNGTVSVRIWDDQGNMRWVTVTSDLPLDENGDPAYGSGNGDVWPAYYEKAFAMVYTGDGDGVDAGNYGALEFDSLDKPSPYITGEGGEELSGFDETREAFESGRPVTVLTPGEAEGWPSEWDNSYSTAHVYYVQGIDDDGNLLLGNPWGSERGTITVTPDQYDEYFCDAEALPVPE